MKKIKYFLYGGLIILFFSTGLLSDTQLSTIYLRHMSILALLGLVTYDLITAYYRYLTKRYEPTGMKEHILSLSRVIVFAFVMISSATIQYKYIDYSVNLHDDRCYFYDEYENLLLAYSTNTSCIEPTLEVHTPELLVLSFDREYSETWENLTHNGTEYNNILGTIRTSIEVTVFYDEERLDLVRADTTNKLFFEHPDITFGSVSKQTSIGDYRSEDNRSYEFKTGFITQDFTDTTYNEIMDYNMNNLILEDSDFTITRFTVLDKLDSDNFIAYTMNQETIEEEESVTTELFEFLIAKEVQIVEPYSVDYSINYTLTDTEKSNNVAQKAKSVDVGNDFVGVDNTIEYENEYYLNSYIYGDYGDYNMLESHHLTHILNGEVTYEGTTTLDYFQRGGKQIYHRLTTNTLNNLQSEFYYTIEELSYGSMVIEMDHVSGSFWEYLFPDRTLDPSDWNRMNNYTTVYTDQQYQFDNDFYVPRMIYNKNLFYTLPIYIQKTALD